MTMFTCEKRGKEFTEKTNLLRHMKTHVDSSQTYSCSICDKEFSRADNRKRHEAPHGQRPLFTCQICNHYFQRMDTFHWHLQTHQRRMDQTPQTGPSKTTKRKLSPPAGPSPKQQRTVSPPPKTHQEKSRVAPIDARVVLPNHISRNKAVVALVGGSNEPHGDNLCFFRCLAVHRGTPNVQALETPAKTYYRQYLQQQDITPADFKGVTLDDLVVLEKVFRLNVYVYD